MKGWVKGLIAGALGLTAVGIGASAMLKKSDGVELENEHDDEEYYEFEDITDEE